MECKEELVRRSKIVRTGNPEDDEFAEVRTKQADEANARLKQQYDDEAYKKAMQQAATNNTESAAGDGAAKLKEAAATDAAAGINKEMQEANEAMKRKLEMMQQEMAQAQAKLAAAEEDKKRAAEIAAKGDSALAAELAKLKADAAKSDEEKAKMEAELKKKAEMNKAAEAAKAHAEAEAKRLAEAVKVAEARANDTSAMEAEVEKRVGDAKKKAADEVAKVKADLDKEQNLRRRYYNEIEDMKGAIRVYCRIRPFMPKEEKAGYKNAVNVQEVGGGQIPTTLSINTGKGDKEYTFDNVFTAANSQADVFKDTKMLMQSALDGYNVCIFAYGQTGAGKSWTMSGSDSPADGTNLGIIPRAINEIYNIMEREAKRYTFEVKLFMVELYLQSIIDLLYKGDDADRPDLAIKKERTGNVYVENSTVVPITGKENLNATYEEALTRRKTASTEMNAGSSRSHLIMTILLKSTNLKTKMDILGKLTMVDLAGSERADKTGATGDTLKEGMAINKSLSCLGDVINALTEGKGHVPYRNHPLTQMMSDSLGGNAKTLMFVNCGPADYNAPETVSSLMFAAWCKTIKNDQTKQIETDAIKALKDELEKLKKAKGGGGRQQSSMLGGS